MTICSRSQAKLDLALAQVQAAAAAAATTGSTQCHAVAADVSTFEGAQKALEAAAAAAGGMQPDVVFCCAGGAKPGFFIEQTQLDFEAGFKTDYMTALATSHAAASLFVRVAKRDAKIVLVSSTLGLTGMVGYAQYSPMKFAIRGLAECLRSELQLYSIDVHAYFPGTILSPGYQEENKTKPAITLELEGDGEKEGLTPKQCAEGLLKGVERGRFFITTDILTELFRAATASGGSVPGNGWLLDKAKSFIAGIGIPVWRIFIADRSIQAHREQHLKDLSLSKPAA